MKLPDATLEKCSPGQILKLRVLGVGRSRMIGILQLHKEQLSEYNRFVESGLCGFEFDRYRDSVRYYCMPHDPKSEEEYASTAKPAFPITETFRKRVSLILQTPAPSKYLEHPDLRDMPAKGYDFIQTVKFGCEYWRDNASDEEISCKAKYVVDTIDSLGCEMGVAGNHPSVSDYVIEILDYAARELKRQKAAVPPKTESAAECVQPTTSPADGAISGYELVERILDRFGDEGVAKLLECVGQGEWEFLEFKTSHLLSDDEKKAGVRQDALTWDIVKAIFGIANTAGGALIIGICKDDKSLWPVAVGANPEEFIRCNIRQKLLPDQRVWSDGKHSRWSAVSVPTVEARLCTYSDGKKTGNVVVLLIEPQPRGECLRFEDAINRDEKLLCYRERGYGETTTSKDSETFDATDRKRRIFRHHYMTLLQKVIPEAGSSSVGKSSGAYRLKPVAGRDVDSCNDELISRTDGHRLRYEFNSGDKIGQYKIIEKIGQGGMGVVYRVEDTTLGGEYALKAFMSTADDCQMQKERFQTEAKLLKRLEHDGLPRICRFDYDERKECLFLVEDLIVGEDNRPHELSEYTNSKEIAESEGLTWVSEDQLLQWLRQVCDVVMYLHRKGVMHRDITLKNLLVTRDRNIKLTDFGIAKVTDEDLRDQVGANVTMTFTLTPNGNPAFVGTLHYLPPEVLEKKSSQIKSEATDMWAIGVCFFKLLTGEWPEGRQFNEYPWYNGKWGELIRGMLATKSDKRMTFESLAKKLTPREIWENVVILDGDDVVREGKQYGARLLFHMCAALTKEGYDVRVYYSINFNERPLGEAESLHARYWTALRRMLPRASLVEFDGGLAKERAMLDACQEHECCIISNGSFIPWVDMYPLLKEGGRSGNSRLHHYTFEDGCFSVQRLCRDQISTKDEIASGERRLSEWALRKSLRIVEYAVWKRDSRRYGTLPTRGRVILVLDTSASMCGSRIEELNASLAAFLCVHGMSSVCFDLSIVGFGRDVYEILPIQPMSNTRDYSVPELFAEGQTSVGSVFQTLLPDFSSHSKDNIPTLVFFLVSELPANEVKVAATQLESYVRQHRIKCFCGCLGAEVDEDQFTDLVPQFDIRCLKGHDGISDYFLWVSQEMEQLCRSLWPVRW